MKEEYLKLVILEGGNVFYELNTPYGVFTIKGFRVNTQTLVDFSEARKPTEVRVEIIGVNEEGSPVVGFTTGEFDNMIKSMVVEDYHAQAGVKK